jgi:hypothetical protein
VIGRNKKASGERIKKPEHVNRANMFEKDLKASMPSSMYEHPDEYGEVRNLFSIGSNNSKIKKSSNRKQNPYFFVLILMYGNTHRISFIHSIAFVLHKCPSGA